MPLLSRLSIAWILGIALARWLNLPWAVFVLLSLPALSALFLYRHNLQVRTGAVFALALMAGAFRLSFFQPVFDETHPAFYNDDDNPLTLTGLVVDEPDVRDFYINLHLKAESIERRGTIQPVEGLVLVRAPRYPVYDYGDRLQVRGSLETPPIFEGFSYRDYLARFGIHSLVRRPRIELVESNQGNLFWTAIFTFKVQASQTINRILAEPYAALLNGILLGIETGIPEALYEKFNLTGASHIIVISGSNIALIAGIFLLLGQKIFGRRAAPPMAIAGIIIYTLLVGADAAVSRAAVMGTLWILAIWSGRPGLALNSLFASALVLTALDPLILGDVGFQLSFMATLGLIVLIPPLERLLFGWLQRHLRTDQVSLMMALFSKLLIVTVAAQIMTGPLILYHFGRFSLVSLLSNLLILPAQPPIMIVGGLATLAGMLWFSVGQLLGWLVWLPLAWSVWVVEQTERLPYASFDFGDFPVVLLILMYATIAAGIWWANHPSKIGQSQPRFRLPQAGSLTTRVWLGGMGVIALLTWLTVLNLPDGRLHVAFLDVGQGDAVLITLPDGRQLLIDGGPSGTDLTWRLGQEMPFWDRTLEMVINTHPDADHLGGLVSLMDRYQVEQLLVSDVIAGSQLYRAWEAEVAEDQLSPAMGRAGMRLAVGSNITATLLNPGPASVGVDGPNNRSIVVHLQFGQVSFLLPGDIEAPVERNLVATEFPLTATVLKSPHHGSKTSSSKPFLEAVNPQIVVISVGEDNRFGHPAPEVLERYIEHSLTILRTDERGTIEFITDGQQVWVETSR